MKKKFELGEDVIRALKDIISINDDCQGAPLVTVKKRESEERERLVQSWKEQALGGDDDETEID